MIDHEGLRKLIKQEVKDMLSIEVSTDKDGDVEVVVYLDDDEVAKDYADLSRYRIND